MFALEREAMFPVNVPRKKRTPRSRPSPSSMATTTPWTRVIEKQRSVELQNPETSPFFAINVSKQEEERSTRKKPKILLPTESTPSEWLLNVMMREGNGYDPKLIIAKKLFQSDLDIGQRRLSMPLKQVVNKDFLTEEESRIIYEQSESKIRKEGVSVDLIDPNLKKHAVNLRRWQMNGGWNYVFYDNWNDVVASNTFKVGDVYHVWSFRSGIGKLCFALDTPPSPTRNSGQDGGSTSVVESIGHAPEDLPAESMGSGSVLPHTMDDLLFGDLTHLETLSGSHIDNLLNINEFDDIETFSSYFNANPSENWVSSAYWYWCWILDGLIHVECL
ncbi:unnamed protein product [Arabis nemorensis]|uniref:TF-B3 domain-containing protein n=1 Tax=Arabis nemorensis TaxID=586526 RepID=A0A565C1M5_9BRAS|nr:unnamed protein product [Arabis nemorensis]